MKKLTFFSVLTFCFVIAGCSDPVEVEPNTKTVVVPGELSVLFVGNIDITEAYALMDDLNLRAIDFSSIEDSTEPNWTIVGVPEGEEEYWSQQLIHHPLIKSVTYKTREVLI